MMHDDEVLIDAGLVGRLIADQFPEYSHLPFREVRSMGTVNAVFRIGGRLAARLPRVFRWSGDLENELAWLPVLRPQLPLPIPRPVKTGRASDDFPMTWAVYEWIDGSPYVGGAIHHEVAAARDLARFVAALRRIDPTGLLQRAECRSLSSTPSLVTPFTHPPTSSTLRRPRRHGTSLWTARSGRSNRYGFTQTCSGRTFW
ncbi:phosphotransferase [Mycetocola miduiensis]|uniref:phosphotransferase n=1 Tax=Mycetocola miduiensis TaxID=995034 RepID=UPI000B020FD4|nr:phosphotransferase [Mycetocola miduiensis]